MILDIHSAETECNKSKLLGSFKIRYRPLNDFEYLESWKTLTTTAWVDFCFRVKSSNENVNEINKRQFYKQICVHLTCIHLFVNYLFSQI